jgi:hypothetical protein
MESKDYKPYPDSGSLFATKSKKFPNSPDYFGNIAINLKDLTNIQTVGGLTVVKISGWKKQSSSGKTYLSLNVDRYTPSQTSDNKPQNREVDDSEVPF